eukprot:CAMPEP_0174763598 /NCGR_PEP_ID=MMETSP1094-20130205/110361_1 /TAXON_ID=156173 /ORGANISM="Chrysochromulina brevifilum, Strain UTEX LB 985" /LENGTH=98 /DNA_ID=CAMNT_0015969555 /DNA_START=818 /DNA_END=1111 /DNA_ORIENTATION=-
MKVAARAWCVLEIAKISSSMELQIEFTRREAAKRLFGLVVREGCACKNALAGGRMVGAWVANLNLVHTLHVRVTEAALHAVPERGGRLHIAWHRRATH